MAPATVVDGRRGVTRWKPGDRVPGILFQNWLDGPLTAAKPAARDWRRHRRHAGVFVVLKEEGLVRSAGPPEAIRDPLRLPCAADGLERIGPRDRSQAGRTVLSQGTPAFPSLLCNFCAAQAPRAS